MKKGRPSRSFREHKRKKGAQPGEPFLLSPSASPYASSASFV